MHGPCFDYFKNPCFFSQFNVSTLYTRNNPSLIFCRMTLGVLKRRKKNKLCLYVSVLRCRAFDTPRDLLADTIDVINSHCSFKTDALIYGRLKVVLYPNFPKVNHLSPFFSIIFREFIRPSFFMTHPFLDTCTCSV